MRYANLERELRLTGASTGLFRACQQTASLNKVYGAMANIL